MSRDRWEAFYGEGTGRDMGIWYEDCTCQMIFQAEKVWSIEREWKDGPVALKVAREEADGLISVDLRLVHTYTPHGMPELVADLYMSELLKDRFRPEDSLVGT